MPGDPRVFGWSLLALVTLHACGSPVATGGEESSGGDESAGPGSTTSAGVPTSTQPGGATSSSDEGGTSTGTTGGASDTGGTTQGPCPEGAEGCPCGPGGQCDGELACVADMCAAGAPGFCGDGAVDPREECDDGANNGDMNACTAGCVHASCGDGLVGPGEGCDDANEVDDDACTNACVPAECGDGVVGPDEACDDGNGANDDACTTACSLAACGDEYVQPGEQEECDDGVDNADNAACTSGCLVNVCGDGKPFDGQGGVEECDDGPGNGPGQACNAGCLLNVCGDGDKGPGEECDDGDLASGDGCSSACALEGCGNGEVDPGEGCDDGADGDNDDECTDVCQPPACGDGFVQAGVGEACDDGNGANSDACTTACEAAACGDGYVHLGVEACDDGNAVDTDGCVAGCTVATCGDGYVHQGVEACDDGNQDEADACTQACAANGVIAVETSVFTTCALLAGGAVRCWGGGLYSQLGIPNSSQPIGDNEHPKAFPPIQLGGPAIDIATGGNHTCAVLQGGTVRCWGSPSGGQIGLATNQQIGDNEHPADAPTLKLGGVVVDVTTFRSHSCAVLVGGLVRCWGVNSLYQLGLGTMSSQNIGDNEHPDSVPPVMIGGTGVATSTGTSHTCALLSTKQMRCWGTANQGQLGLGNSFGIGYDDVPADNPPVVFTDVEDLSSGDRYNCFLRPGGAVHCFGANEAGQLGLGHTDEIGDSESPDVGPIQLGAPAIDVDAGGQHACAVLQGGAVRCWGNNEFGQLGLGHVNNIGDDELPTAAPTIQLGGPAVRVSAGSDHTCALMATGKLRCWGKGDSGRLGYANNANIGDDEAPEVAGDVQVY